MSYNLWYNESRLVFVMDDVNVLNHVMVSVSDIATSWMEPVLCDIDVIKQSFKSLNDHEIDVDLIYLELARLNNEINTYSMQIHEKRISVANAVERMARLRDERKIVVDRIVMQILKR